MFFLTMKHPFRCILPFIFLFSFVSIALSSNPLVINIPKETFKGDNKNWAIDQDERGYIYVANNSGLLQFDGVSWKSFTLPQSTIVRSLYVKDNRQIYTGSFEDFGVWTRSCDGSLSYQSLLSETDRKEQHNNDFWRILEFDNKIYFQSFSSIFIYDGVNSTPVSSSQGFLFLSKVGNELYVQTMNGGLNRIVGQVLEKLEGSDFLSNTDVRIILPYPKGLLIGTSTQGFFSYVNGDFKVLDSGFKTVARANPNVGILGKNGNYYIGTISDGLFQLNSKGDILEHISTEFDLKSNTILSLYQDQMNDVWLGLDGGISLVRDLPDFDVFTNINSGLGAIYDAVLWKGFLYLATNHQVYAIAIKDLEKPQVKRGWIPLEGTEGQSWSFKETDGRLLVLNNSGVYEIHSNFRVTRFTDLEVGVYDMLPINIDGQELLLYGTYFRVWKSNLDGLQLEALEDLKEPISLIEMDHINNLWLEHPQKGVFRCRFNRDLSGFESINHYGGSKGLPYRLRLFKVGGRVELYGDGQFFSYYEQTDSISSNKILDDALQAFDISKVIPIKDSYFFGLSHKSVTKFYYDGYHVKIISNLELSPFLLPITEYENISILNDSTQLVCLDNGFGIYRDSLRGKEYGDSLKSILPKPMIESMIARNSNHPERKVSCINLSEPISIAHTLNSVNWVVTIPNQFNKNLKLNYRLKGLSDSWVILENSNEIHYDRLPPGEYQLELKTVGILGDESAINSLPFHINKPFYITPTAIVLYILIIGCMGYLIWRLILIRYRNMHLRKIRQREVLRLRSKAENLESEVESKNAELMTMTSFIVSKNEVITKLRSLAYDFQTKNNLKSLAPLIQRMDALISQSVNPEDDWKMFLMKFEAKNANFFTKLMESYPDLTSSDLRLCACLKLNMDTKEIASLMDASIRSIENRRYRLRKKMGLSAEQNLNEFLILV